MENDTATDSTTDLGLGSFDLYALPANERAEAFTGVFSASLAPFSQYDKLTGAHRFANLGFAPAPMAEVLHQDNNGTALTPDTFGGACFDIATDRAMKSEGTGITETQFKKDMREYLRAFGVESRLYPDLEQQEAARQTDAVVNRAIDLAWETKKNGVAAYVKTMLGENQMYFAREGSALANYQADCDKRRYELEAKYKNADGKWIGADGKELEVQKAPLAYVQEKSALDRRLKWEQQQIEAELLRRLSQDMNAFTASNYGKYNASENAKDGKWYGIMNAKMREYGDGYLPSIIDSIRNNPFDANTTFAARSAERERQLGVQYTEKALRAEGLIDALQEEGQIKKRMADREEKAQKHIDTMRQNAYNEEKEAEWRKTPEGKEYTRGEEQRKSQERIESLQRAALNKQQEAEWRATPEGQAYTKAETEAAEKIRQQRKSYQHNDQIAKPYKAGVPNSRTFITGFSKQYMDAGSEADYPLGVYVVPPEEYKRMVQDMGVKEGGAVKCAVGNKIFTVLPGQVKRPSMNINMLLNVYNPEEGAAKKFTQAQWEAILQGSPLSVRIFAE